MEEKVIKVSSLMRDNNLVLVTAESCTGGMIAKLITDLAGSSQIFDRGFVTYSNEAKMEMLGVPAHIIEEHGAVSHQCASAMALGALNNSKAGISVSVTGIAGPDGGSDKKPVGLVYIGIDVIDKGASVTENVFTGTRSEIRALACGKALDLLIDAIHSI